ncbi:MAG: caspase family protein [Paludibacteraceae bacterium]|nr:caspase family protein [Paludibacteraceae bacterium]MBO5829620.1 caspase family protein [Paludibacteraceae bacterium]
MKKFICIILLIAASYNLSHATKRALVIGIGNYPEASGWAKINGDKDLPIVRDMLLANGFQSKDIVELKNESATADAIRKALDALVGKAAKGDVIYIHFSGHGQQITDLHGDEEDGFDEAWIPIDAQFSYAKGKYEGENHIVDDQLNQWLSQLRSKVGATGKITVVADACHSGGGSRGDKDETKYVVRGTSDAFVIPGNTKPFSGEVGTIDWIFISACKSYQCNYEYKGTGSLTYALGQQKANLSSTPAQQVQRSIRSTIANIIPFTQTPVLEASVEGTQQSLF